MDTTSQQTCPSYIDASLFNYIYATTIKLFLISPVLIKSQLIYPHENTAWMCFHSCWLLDNNKRVVDIVYDQLKKETASSMPKDPNKPCYIFVKLNILVAKIMLIMKN